MKVAILTILILLSPISRSAFAFTDIPDEPAQEVAIEDPADDGSDVEDSFNPGSSCAVDYDKRRGQLLKRSVIGALLVPEGAFAGLITGAYAGSYLGPALTSGSSTWASISGSAWGALIGFSGAGLFLSLRDALMVFRLFQNHRMIELIKESHSPSNDPKDLPLLVKIQSGIEAKGGKSDLLSLKEKVLKLDETRALCDGTRRGSTNSTKLRKRLVEFHQLRKQLEEEAK